MRRQIELAGAPTLRAIGVDEISLCKGHNYRVIVIVIVSDLDRRRPIWVGGEGRKDKDLDEFFEFIGKTKSYLIKHGRHGYGEGLQEINFEECPGRTDYL